LFRYRLRDTEKAGAARKSRIETVLKRANPDTGKHKTAWNWK